MPFTYQYGLYNSKQNVIELLDYIAGTFEKGENLARASEANARLLGGEEKTEKQYQNNDRDKESGI